MYLSYHRAIVDAQYLTLTDRIAAERWSDLSVERHEALIYVRLQVSKPRLQEYLCRIDMRQYPVEPYWIGFLNPDARRERWSDLSDSDPRFWPWSPMPGLHGSFNITFLGPFRTFWCREFTVPFFYYHGLERKWSPGHWPLDRVVANLRDAIKRAEPPHNWRPIQQL